VAIDAGVTGVNTFRQSSRSLANTTQMVRDIAEDQAKLETSTEAEVSSAAVHQIASVSTGIPNVLLESNLFVNWVQTDLMLAWRYAVDDHVVDKITAASIPTGGGGSNAFEDIPTARRSLRLRVTSRRSSSSRRRTRSRSGCCK
jgi:hypothetical protein